MRHAGIAHATGRHARPIRYYAAESARVTPDAFEVNGDLDGPAGGAQLRIGPSGGSALSGASRARRLENVRGASAPEAVISRGGGLTYSQAFGVVGRGGHLVFIGSDPSQVPPKTRFTIAIELHKAMRAG